MLFCTHAGKVVHLEDGRPPLKVRIYETHLVTGAWRIDRRADGWYASREGRCVGPCASEGLLNQELKRE